MKRHPRLSERSSSIYEANRVTAEDEPRVRELYGMWKETVGVRQPGPNHVWNTDETGVLVLLFEYCVEPTAVAAIWYSGLYCCFVPLSVLLCVVLFVLLFCTAVSHL